MPWRLRWEGSGLAVAVAVGSGTSVAVGCGAVVAVGSSPWSQAASAISATMVSVAQMRANFNFRLVSIYLFSHCELSRKFCYQPLYDSKP